MPGNPQQDARLSRLVFAGIADPRWALRRFDERGGTEAAHAAIAGVFGQDMVPAVAVLVGGNS